MEKDSIRGYIGAVSKGMLLIAVVATCLIVIPGFVMVFSAKGMVRPLSAVYPAEAAERLNPSILKWMKSNSEMSEEVLSDVYRASIDNVNSDLILAICMVESNFNPNVKSTKGAIGLMGILPQAWLDELRAQGIVQRKEDLYQISNNIASGAYVLQKYLSRSKTLERALTDYVGGDPEYVRKVMKALRELYLAKWSRPEAA